MVQRMGSFPAPGILLMQAEGRRITRSALPRRRETLRRGLGRRALRPTLRRGLGRHALRPALRRSLGRHALRPALHRGLGRHTLGTALSKGFCGRKVVIVHGVSLLSMGYRSWHSFWEKSEGSSREMPSMSRAWSYSTSA